MAVFQDNWTYDDMHNWFETNAVAVCADFKAEFTYAKELEKPADIAKIDTSNAMSGFFD